MKGNLRKHAEPIRIFRHCAIEILRLQIRSQQARFILK